MGLFAWKRAGAVPCLTAFMFIGVAVNAADSEPTVGDPASISHLLGAGDRARLEINEPMPCDKGKGWLTIHQFTIIRANGSKEKVYTADSEPSKTYSTRTEAFVGGCQAKR